MGIQTTAKTRIGRVGQVIRHLWRRRRNFSSICSWLWYQYDFVLNRFARAPLPWRRRTVSVRVRGLGAPLLVRVGTTDLHVVEEIFFDGEYEDLIRAIPADAKTILDLGSNVGLSLRLWAEHFPNARVVGVEPDGENYELCVRNARVKDPELSRTRVVRACVAGEARTVTLDRSAGEWAFRIAEGNGAPGATEQVQALTVPQIMERAGVEGPIDVVKCDIEGAEREVMGADTAWLRTVRAMAIELHAPYDEGMFRRDLARVGGLEVRRTLKDLPGVSVLLVAPSRVA